MKAIVAVVPRMRARRLVPLPPCPRTRAVIVAAPVAVIVVAPVAVAAVAPVAVAPVAVAVVAPAAVAAVIEEIRECDHCPLAKLNVV